jgi:hypothetical protein
MLTLTAADCRFIVTLAGQNCRFTLTRDILAGYTLQGNYPASLKN